jgi:hypothetical protein
MAALDLHQLPLALPMTQDELRATLVVLPRLVRDPEPEPLAPAVAAQARRAA